MFWLILIPLISALKLTPIGLIVKPNTLVTLTCCSNSTNFTFYPNFTKSDNLNCATKIIIATESKLYECSNGNDTIFTRVFVVDISKRLDIAIINTNYSLNCYDGENSNFIFRWSNQGKISNKLILPITKDVAKEKYICEMVSYDAIKYYGNWDIAIQEGIFIERQIDVAFLEISSDKYIFSVITTKNLVIKWFVHDQEVNSSTIINNVIQSSCNIYDNLIVKLNYNFYFYRFNITQLPVASAIIEENINTTGINVGIGALLCLAVLCIISVVCKKKKRIILHQT
jgi:hypothetical protein